LITPSHRPAGLSGLQRAAAIVVSSEDEAERLRRWGHPDVVSIPPGIDLRRFGRVPPASGPFTLMMASAPWTRRQFRSKGIDALLRTVARRPGLRLVLLWRGALRRTVERRIAASGLTDRVVLLDGAVDVAQTLEQVHAVVLVVSSRRVVKAFPHSLLEGLAAGRPVITSPLLAISRLVADSGAGLVAECDAEALGSAVDRLQSEYGRYRAAAEALDLGPYSLSRHLDSYRALYERLAPSATATP
jgi:glycosyltransferase involved in cell wall biosynthesis